MTRYREMTQQYGDFLAVMIAELRRHPELASAMERPLRAMQGIADLVERYQREGVLRQEPPFHAVAALLGPLVYFAMAHETFYADQQPIDLEAHIAAFLDGRRSSIQKEQAL